MRISDWSSDVCSSDLRICHAGIGRTFQIVKPFKELSALDNVIVGALRAEPDVRSARKKAEAVLDRLGMLDKRDQPAAQLTLPERTRLEVARALAHEPRDRKSTRLNSSH